MVYSIGPVFLFGPEFAAAYDCRYEKIRDPITKIMRSSPRLFIVFWCGGDCADGIQAEGSGRASSTGVRAINLHKIGDQRV